MAWQWRYVYNVWDLSLWRGNDCNLWFTTVLTSSSFRVNLYGSVVMDTEAASSAGVTATS